MNLHGADGASHLDTFTLTKSVALAEPEVFAGYFREALTLGGRALLVRS